ncbi:replication-relaxation family protein [Klebsiella pneumoniae]|nr:replication-relaxation family protein [Klebsiella pneumoniae]
MFHGGAGCATAGDCGGTAGLPLLDSLVAKGLLVRAKYPVDGRQVSVWGLTPHGVAFSFDEDEPLTDVIPFQPSRVSAAQLPHRLAVQSLRLSMEGRGPPAGGTCTVWP